MNNEKIKIVYVVSTVDFSYGMKWMGEFLPADKYDITFIFLYQKKPMLVDIFHKLGIKTIYFNYNSKYDLIKVAYRIYKLLRRIKPQIVHAHLFEASLASLVPAYVCGVPARIYTRHHSSIHHDNFPNAVKYDRLVNRLAHKIVAISDNVKSILINKENVPANKVVLIHHGFNFTEIIGNYDKSDVVLNKYHLENTFPIIGVISRFTHFKGIQDIIPAFKILLSEYPDAVLVLANAVGDYKNEIMEMLKILPESNTRIIEFETNVFDLYRCFDVFVHVPIDATVEAFGQIYIEAMALKVPVVCTPSGVGYEYIENGKNAVVVPFGDSVAIENGILKILKDKDFANRITEEGYKNVFELFEIKGMIKKLDELYMQSLNGK